MEEEDGLIGNLVYSDSEESVLDNSPIKFEHQNLSPDKKSNENSNNNSEDSDVPISKPKKVNKKILSSDGENDKSDTKNEKSIIDEDSSNSEEVESTDRSTNQKKKKKILKSRKELNKNIINKGNDSSSSESENENHEKKSAKKSLDDLYDKESSMSSNSDDEQVQDVGKSPPKREKHIQRKSAKNALDDIKEIQSESQRIAREIYINIPYHKPKQHSLQEFLNRRSLSRQHDEMKPYRQIKAAAAIKMSEAELTEYAKKMEQRAQEAIEFFENENDNEEKTEDKTVFETIESNDQNDIKNNAITLVDDIGHQLLEKMETDEIIENTEIAPNSNENPFPSTSNEPNDVQENPSTDEVAFHSEKTDLDLELDKMANEQKRKNFAFSLGAVPCLHGDKNTIIDLETNEIKAREKSEVEKLQERFIAHTMIKPTHDKNKYEKISVFNPDIGGLETINSSLKSDLKPGQAYVSLKEELSKKINEKRRENLMKRLEEKICKQKELEFDDDEEEILDDEEYEIIDDDEEGQEITEDVIDNDVEDEEIESACQGSEEEESDNGNQENEKPRVGRIVRAFEDSDDDESTTTDLQKIVIAESNFDPMEEASQNLGENNSFNEKSQNMQNLTDKSISEEMKEFESRIFDIDSQKQTTIPALAPTPQTAGALFEEANDDIDESQLMALCSGAFVTQHQPEIKSPIETEVVENEEYDPKRTFLSSDEETEEFSTTKQKKSKNKKKLNFSDDENDDGNSNENQEENESEIENEEEEMLDDDVESQVIETFIEYDSDENEIVVPMKQKDIRRKASEFVENEAELSESEWGSADEDEKDLDRFEKELGDEDEFDQNKLQSELERIRLRQQVDEDAREVRILKEMFIEEEEDGETRERKFRWKNVDGTFDMSATPIANDENAGENSDEENEEEWRRSRYEREQLLLKQGENKNISETNEISEQSITETASETTTPISIFRKSIIKTVKTSSSVVTSPFLLSLNGSGIAGRKSFLKRDLEKLTTMMKSSSDEFIKTTNKQNYVFVATEKPNNKRRSDEVSSLEENQKNKIKKQKLNSQQKSSKGFLQLLSK